MTKRTDGPSSAVKLRVFKRDRFRCTYCGAPGTDAELEVDHIIAVARGGSHHISNLTTACRMCNQKKGAGELKRAPQRESAPQANDVHALVQAQVERVVYNFKRREVEIHLADGDCVDMSGAIELAMLVMPHVKRIQTYSGAAPDTKYWRNDIGRWEAFDASEAVA